MLPGVLYDSRRHLPLTGTYNVRDIGGYATADGRTTRWQAVWRADSLHRLSAPAQQTLLSYGVRTIVDLRRSDELRVAPNVFAHSDRVRYHHLSVLDDVPSVPGPTRPLVETYRYLLDNRQEQVAAVLQILAAPDGLPAVMHCTAGKDRTGVMAALLLGLVGVPAATITADYFLTATYLQGAFMDETRRRALQRGYTWEQYQPLVQCPPDFMQDTLQYLEAQYGGVTAYIRAIGLSEAHVAHLQTVLLD